MQWLKEDTNERNKIHSRLIRTKFGAEGYGIYKSLREVIAENVLPDNIDDWGHVNPLHTIETLAQECSVTPERLREFLEFCNEKKIFEKHKERLYCKDILNRLDDYAARVQRENKRSTE